MPAANPATHNFFVAQRSALEEEAQDFVSSFNLSEEASARLVQLGSVAAIAQVSSAVGLADTEEVELLRVVQAAKAHVNRIARGSTPLAKASRANTPAGPGTPSGGLRKTRMLNPPHLVPPPIKKLNLQEVPGSGNFPSFRPKYCHAKNSARRNFNHFWKSTAMPNSCVDEWAERVYSRGAANPGTPCRQGSPQVQQHQQSTQRTRREHPLMQSFDKTHTQELLEHAKKDAFGSNLIPPKAWWSFAFKNSGRMRKDCGHLLSQARTMSRASQMY